MDGLLPPPASPLHGRIAPVVAWIRFLDHVETGRVAEASRILPSLDTRREPPAIREALESRRTLLALMVETAEPQADRPGPGWADVTRFLRGGRPAAALDRARADARSDEDLASDNTGFSGYTLVRAELAAGHGEAARRLLLMRAGCGNVHYLDDFFCARVQRLAGDWGAAAQHFGAALAAVRRYRAEGRLDFEIRLACELPPRDLVRLWKAAETATGPPAPTAVPEARAARATQDASQRGLARLLGPSAAMTSVREALARFAPSDAPVLLAGETGTGKELAARALHEAGPRSAEPFLAVNCGAIPESLLETELFGHERGAFTGAARAHKGLFEQAGSGTILLDEIGEIPPRLQIALLRVIETGEIRSVGSEGTRRAACRILAATNADLEGLAAEGRFRSDLLFRLRHLEVTLPPLRSRPEDIVPLARHFLAEGRRDGRQPEMSQSLEEALRQEPWPGNVRELRNAIERMRILNSDALSYDAEAFRVARNRSGLGLREAPQSLPQAGAEVAPPEKGRESRPPGPRPGVTSDAAVGELLRQGRTSLRRLDRLRDLFRTHGKLTRGEVSEILGVSQATALRDLHALVREGFVKKVEPTGAPRTHYFALRAREG